MKEKLAEEFANEKWPEQEDDKETWDSVINGQMYLAYLAGFDKAKELLSKKMELTADWSFEGWNQGDMTLQECARHEIELRHWARVVKRLGDEEA